MPEFGPEEFAAQTHVSRETLVRLKAYAGLLQDWNTRHNLVSQASLQDLWPRHFWDSAQLVPLIPPDAKTLVDLGSGAGFPGLVLAELLRDRLAVTLYEATAKKCAFLSAAADRMGLAVTIRNTRMEDAAPEPFDIVTARACAPLSKLLAYASTFTGPQSRCLFLKGQNLGSELTEAHKSWKMKTRQIPSQTHPSGAILEVTDLRANDRSKPKKASHPGGRQSKGRRR
ncbi:MAG TPA: 16S rRNA (guanine(527)-N(7))-methyltransferase RsmG [Rhizomicrobium sp.]|nr:16S rRNA (guanine(527)-N(7))-methyltransferase RsmG [Rhizomicrobium sp.]